MGTLGKSNRNDVYREVEQALGRVPEWLKPMPDAALGSFWSTMRDLELGETKIPNKYKELIGLGVSGATRCRYCALFHTEAARLFGATDEEIAEASAMAGLTMAISTFVNAQQVDYEKFKKETLEIVRFVKAKGAGAHDGARSNVAPQGPNARSS
jgi:AhpD family alkylhydroperoxidase